MIGSNHTRSSELLASALMGNGSVSLSRYTFSTNGARTNDDTDTRLFGGFGQLAISPSITLSIEHRRRETDEGDRVMNFDPEDFSQSLRRHVSSKTTRAGIRWSPVNDFTLVGTYATSSRTDRSTDEPLTSVFFSSTDKISTNEVQGAIYYKRDRFNLIAGVHYANDDGVATVIFDDQLFGLASVDLIPINKILRTYFVHSNIQLFNWLGIHLGGSYESLHTEVSAGGRYNPKIGLTARIFDIGTIRATYYTNLTKPIVSAQTLEPTEIGGFNQFFDDKVASETERYGARIDFDKVAGLNTGIEASTRFSKTPFLTVGLGIDHEKVQEKIYAAYLNATPVKSLALSLEPQFESLERPNSFRQFTAPQVKTWIVLCSFTDIWTNS